jgi:hypothetical protein
MEDSETVAEQNAALKPVTIGNFAATPFGSKRDRRPSQGGLNGTPQARARSSTEPTTPLPPTHASEDPGITGAIEEGEEEIDGVGVEMEAMGEAGTGNGVNERDLV